MADFALELTSNGTDWCCPAFIDHAGTKGSCAIKPDGSALDILSCQEGDEEVTQKVYLDCAVPDNPKYCNDFK